MLSRRSFIQNATVFSAFFLDSPAPAQETEPKDLFQLLSRSPDLGSFKHLVMEAGLIQHLQDRGPFTLFAPTDSSIRRPGGRAKLAELILEHIVAGEFSGAEIIQGACMRNLRGHTVVGRLSQGKAWIGRAQLLQADTYCKNGVLHKIDHWLAG